MVKKYLSLIVFLLTKKKTRTILSAMPVIIDNNWKCLHIFGQKRRIYIILKQQIAYKIYVFI